ncbi:tetratricopeptide repeat protein [Alistipes sp.]|uniref:tetratricopeptide repeat protein n=1 Tax=Alistipes sp. TaxID=1872444 RepID=UPI0025B7CC28|nr:tetratricopeptide repeat protein [Alistipes sp.]
MKRLTATTVLCLLLFFAAFVSGKGTPAVPEYPDSLRSVWLYTEGIKQNIIAGDTARARELFLEAVRNDSTCAPAWYELAGNLLNSSPEEAVEMARRACRLDTANKWYQQFYGQALILSNRLDEALKVYRRLMENDPKDPDNYRIVAALYEQKQSPVMALVTLDSAELRFGRIPLLSTMKRRLLVATNQLDKAVAEAQAMVEAAPYEAQHHVVLGDLYAIAKKNSLARAEYDLALQIDSTNVQTLMALADFHAGQQDYRALLAVTRQLFQSDELPLETKIKRFEQFTSDTRFYREYYFQLNDLASTLAIRYPDDRRVVELYAGHLIASGELEQALALYKSHLGDRPLAEEYFRAVIDIESYLQRPDSVDKYVTHALELFPAKIDFHLAKGHVMGLSKQYDKAIDIYKEALHHADTDSLRSAIWGMIGDTWHQKAEAGEPNPEGSLPLHTDLPARKGSARKAMKECYEAYERSLRYWSDNAMVLNNYAYFLSLEGRDLERALNMSSRVVAITDNNPTYLDTHGWVLFKLGRTDEARKILQKAVALDGQKSPELMIHYGDILHLLGEQFMAEIYWRRALEKGYDARQIEQRLQQPPITKSEPKE